MGRNSVCPSIHLFVFLSTVHLVGGSEVLPEGSERLPEEFEDLSERSEGLTFLHEGLAKA